MRHQLRPYQADAIERVRESVRNGKRRIVLVAPTGSGKTTIASSIIESAVAKGGQCLFLAHRRELVHQASARLTATGLEHGIIMAGHKPSQHPVQVASVQTLARRALHPADLIIVDEAHHATVANTYGKILDRYDWATVIGLTATPWRLDGVGLGGLFDDLVLVNQAHDLAPKYLMEPAVYAPSSVDLTGVHSRAGDYATDHLEDRLMETGLIGDVVAHWLEYAEHRRTLVFAATVRHSHYLRDAFIAAGVPAEHLDAKTPAHERDGILGRLKAGTTRVVCNVGILTEGYDLPELGCISLCRPTQSSVLYLQMVGRVMRPLPGKAQPLILDHANCCHAHGLPLDEREYSLDGLPARDPKGDKETRSKVTVCKGCFAVMPAGQAMCSQCRLAAPPPDPQRYINRRGELVRVKRPRRVQTNAPEHVKREAYRRLLDIASSRGYKPGWAMYRFKARFGVWPAR